ncbi:calmodulin-binding protein 25-like [Oryza brachyantha]|uniref:VQ domain-containing protein n=1 Tax=Oryza brachyantha TaxID=4533 RepID=J3MN43_ORYBR|nr:calmodulin-binding protein 25-like [Oryza brachyantha]
MASTTTAGDSHSLPSSPATSPSVFLDDHPSFLRSPSSTPTFLDQIAPSSFYLPGVVPDAAGAREYSPPLGQLAQAARKPTRKRPRASRRPPTTVLTTDASNFRAMVQEFTGFPAPPPLSSCLPPHLLSGGALLPSGSAAPAAFQPTLASSPTTNATSLVLDALALLAKTKAIAAAAAAAPPSSGSELYSSYGPVLARAIPFDDGFEVADGESTGAGGGHGLLSSTTPYAGERRY